MKVSVGISNHHVHVTKEDYIKLFGKDDFTIRNSLKQPGQFACCEKVIVKGLKGLIENVVIVGPFREYTQVEISKTDSYILGVNPPVADSGDLSEACLLTIIGPNGQIERKCGIIARRHIHIDENIRKEKKLLNVKEVKLKISGEKSGIIDHVYLKDSDKAFFEVHLDTDDANAFLINNNDELEIL